MQTATLPSSSEMLQQMAISSCDKCAHNMVCLTIRVVGQMLQEPNFTKENLPFKVFDLAKICSFYVNASVLQAIKENC